MEKIIDVSEYQGVIDWRKVRGAGITFAILKITKKSNNADSKFLANATGCNNNGMTWDVYKYTYAQDEKSAEKEARAVVDLLNRTEGSKGVTVWWDLEDYSLRNIGRSKLTRNTKAAQRVIESAGYTFGIYCNKDWYNNVLDVKEFDCPFWIARYPYTQTLGLEFTPSPKYVPQMKCGHQLVGWQYTSKGRVPGIVGNCDVSLLYV